MRQLCAHCQAPQPTDWQPGDLCIHCGAAARPELRCFWCCRWTPEGRFCRTCGAATVAPALFGAARMLKEAGVDRFRIPAALTEFDPGQIDHFTALYQRHAAAIHRHAEVLRDLEPRTLQPGWSQAFTGQWLPRLPHAEDVLADLERSPAPPLAGDLSLLIEIRTAHPGRLPEALALFHQSTGALRLEAALVLTGWRAAAGPGLEGQTPALFDTLAEAPPSSRLAVRAHYFHRPGPAIPPEALDDPDPDEAFYAALALGHPDRLRAAALDSPDPLARSAAATRLAELGEAWDTVAAALSSLPDPELTRLLQFLDSRRVTPTPLRPALFSLLSATARSDIRFLAARLLARDCPSADVLLIAARAHGDRRIYQALLQRTPHPPAILADLGAFLLARDDFQASQFGLRDIAAPGRMPTAFVPAHWSRATATQRAELCAFAEMQLHAGADPDLHRFLVGVALGDDPHPVRRAAWSGLYRWYDSFGYPRRRPLALEAAAIGALFPSPAAFLTALTRFLVTRGDSLADIIVRDPVLHLLRDADPNILPACAAAPAEAAALLDALGHLLLDPAADFSVRLAALTPLTLLAGLADLRPAALDSLTRCQGTDLAWQAAEAARRGLSAPPSTAAPSPSSSAE